MIEKAKAKAIIEKTYNVTNELEKVSHIIGEIEDEQIRKILMKSLASSIHDLSIDIILQVAQYHPELNPYDN